MTDTTTPAPTDEDLVLEARKIGGLFDDLAVNYQFDDIVRLARAVLAKWGAPAPASGEPSFYTVFASHNGGPIPLPGYSNETEHGVKNLVLEAARRDGYKGTAAGRLLELGWWIGPVYSAPTGGVPMAIPADVLEAAKSMQQNQYRGSLAWAAKVVDFVAGYTAPGATQ